MLDLQPRVHLHAGAIPKLAALVGSEPLDAWKDWLAFHTLNQQANVLPKAFRDASFAFYGTTLNGTPKQRPRDQLAMNSVSAALQDAVGKAYVDKYFSAAAKSQVQNMVGEIKAALCTTGWPVASRTVRACRVRST